MRQDASAALRCSRCGTRITECAFCDEPDCPAAICYGCLNVALGQEMPQPHVHGG
jgi:hypothetical protein